MALEQPTELAAANAQPFGQPFDVGLLAVQRAVGDQRQRAAYRVGGAAPEGEVGGDLRPTAQAGTEARLLGGRRRGEEPAVLELGRAGRADRPAVDAGRCHADEDATVEAGVVGLEGAVEGSAVEQFHGCIFPCTRARCSRFSDLCRQTNEFSGPQSIPVAVKWLQKASGHVYIYKVYTSPEA